MSPEDFLVNLRVLADLSRSLAKGIAGASKLSLADCNEAQALIHLMNHIITEELDPTVVGRRVTLTT